MDQLMTQQVHTQGLIQRFLTNFKKIGKDKITRGTISSRISLLNSYWSSFSSRHNEILKVSAAEDLQSKLYFIEDHFDKTENCYLETLATLSDTLEKFNQPLSVSPQSQAIATSSQSQPDSLLPRITIPKFGGCYTEWMSFKDLFISLVDKNKRLSDAEKLHYLRANLVGEAASLLENLSITEANYNGAWTILSTRYDNTRILVHHHLRAIFSLPSVPPEKIPMKIREDWEQHICDSNDMPKFSDLESFLITRIRMLDTIKPMKPVSNQVNKPTKLSRHTHSTALVSTTTLKKPTKKCLICFANHFILFCPQFRQKTVEERRSFAAKENLCFNCLRSGHSRNNCPSSNRCQLCKKMHHTMVHTSDHEADSNPDNVDPVSLVKAYLANPQPYSNHAILATAWVNVKSNTGHDVRLRALLDQGSEASFISEAARQQLNLAKRKLNMKISGIGACDAASTKGVVTLQITSSLFNNFTFTVEALVLSKLTNYIPTNPVNISDWTELKDLPLADPTFYAQSRVDLILGAEVYCKVILPGLKRDSCNSLLAQNTQLGWIISGVVNNQSSFRTTKSDLVQITTHISTLQLLEEQLRKFWEVEDISNQKFLTDEEESCEKFFKETHRRASSGRYIVRLPTRLSPNQSMDLGESRTIAIQRLQQLERRFERQPKLKEDYLEFMHQYLQLGHMEPVYPSLDTKPVYYIPHHGVYKTIDPNSKLRVVFNTSQQTSNAVSLNERLLPGPKLQRDLWDIITRWRLHTVLFTADIEKMFRQIWVDDIDTNLQMIVWRESSADPILDFRLKTVTYGTVPAPYLAIRTLHQLAHDEILNYPSAAEILLRDTYVDDILTGSDNLKSALALKTELNNLLNAGGFTLKKWATNYDALLDDIPPDSRGGSSHLYLEPDNTVKTLGILWNADTDSFGFKVNLPSHPPDIVTKRNLLSEVSKLFDPLGFLSPSIILAKSLLQRLWLEGLNWDDPLPSNIVEEWIHYRQQLHLLEAIRVPRWIGTNSTQISCELHGYSDASNIAYAAVLYSRTTLEDGTIHVCLLASKTKVAPLKTLSIPILELCAVVILTRLLNKIKSSLSPLDPVVFAWTDSSIVLAWLRSQPCRWTTFVANRVAEIQSSLNISQWRYVPSSKNPADSATRGLFPEHLRTKNLWWNGPDWLAKHSTFWPTGIAALPPGLNLEERKEPIAMTAQAVPEFKLADQYSSLTKLIRVTAYCRRFVFNAKQKEMKDRLSDHLKSTELQDALDMLIKTVQHESFQAEIKNITSGKPIPKSSNLLRLNPFVDNDGFLRVGGRLKHALLTLDGRFSRILPKYGSLTRLLIQNAHVITLHGGTQQTLGYLRRKFWILDGRNSVRNFIHRCVTCFRHAAVLKTQLMSSLPPPRVRPSRPFQHTGVDYAGPLTIKMSKGRGQRTQKGYICIFVCFSTKAVHIELVGDFTTASFIAAFKRLTARRGICTDLYSDRGTNFIGADAELTTKLSLIKRCSSNNFPEILENDGTSWHFLPAYSPHFGGIWEAAVKSVKFHLKRIIGDCILTFEEMLTVLSQVEAALNSRPIFPLSDDPDDNTALTPGHFLIGGPINVIPEPSILHLKENYLSRWQLTQRIFELFWKRWSVEYLNTLQQRYKWKKTQPPVKLNDLVLLKDDRLPPGKWSLGRVVALHPGDDNLIRVVSVRCRGTVTKRPIVKLAVLPASDDDSKTMMNSSSSENQN